MDQSTLDPGQVVASPVNRDSDVALDDACSLKPEVETLGSNAMSRNVYGQ